MVGSTANKLSQDGDQILELDYAPARGGDGIKETGTESLFKPQFVNYNRNINHHTNDILNIQNAFPQNNNNNNNNSQDHQNNTKCPTLMPPSPLSSLNSLKNTTSPFPLSQHNEEFAMNCDLFSNHQFQSSHNNNNNNNNNNNDEDENNLQNEAANFDNFHYAKNTMFSLGGIFGNNVQIFPAFGATIISNNNTSTQTLVQNQQNYQNYHQNNFHPHNNNPHSPQFGSHFTNFSQLSPQLAPSYSNHVNHDNHDNNSHSDDFCPFDLNHTQLTIQNSVGFNNNNNNNNNNNFDNNNTNHNNNSIFSPNNFGANFNSNFSLFPNFDQTVHTMFDRDSSADYQSFESVHLNPYQLQTHDSYTYGTTTQNTPLQTEFLISLPTIPHSTPIDSSSITQHNSPPQSRHHPPSPPASPSFEPNFQQSVHIDSVTGMKTTTTTTIVKSNTVAYPTPTISPNVGLFEIEQHDLVGKADVFEAQPASTPVSGFQLCGLEQTGQHHSGSILAAAKPIVAPRTTQMGKKGVKTGKGKAGKKNGMIDDDTFAKKEYGNDGNNGNNDEGKVIVEATAGSKIKAEKVEKKKKIEKTKKEIKFELKQSENNNNTTTTDSDGPSSLSYESHNISNITVPARRASNMRTNSNLKQQMDSSTDDEWSEKQKYREKNRLSAQKSRQRKRDQLVKEQSEFENTKNENVFLKTQVFELEAKIKAYEMIIMELKKNQE